MPSEVTAAMKAAVARSCLGSVRRQVTRTRLVTDPLGQTTTLAYDGWGAADLEYRPEVLARLAG